MKNYNFNKDNFDIKKLNLIIENYYKENNLLEDNILDAQLICEEFLSNILFPNFDGEINFSVLNNKENIVLSFVYAGSDFMNKINEQTILSLKILRKKTEEITNEFNDNKTTVNFIIKQGR